MEGYNATGALKTGKLTVNRPIGAVAIGVSDVDALTNETLTYYIESPNGSERGATKINLLSVVALSVHGLGGGFVMDGLTYFVIPVAIGGALDLSENEEFVLEMEGLKAAERYAVEFLDGNETNGSLQIFDQNVFIAEKTTMTLNTEGFRFMAIRGVSNLSEINCQLVKSGGNRKYTKVGIRAMESQGNDFTHEQQLTEGTIDGIYAKVGFTQDIAILNVANYREVEFLKAAGNAVQFEMIR
ncbi:hypothetical protein [Roseivirga thermotolerans]|uniref:Uncharacterized protein n=1 Tax=Roseivirga thermotolerans TaxID=1758176 RepID=A0ABQ3IBZ7_9BACT|nr:hypothetical protein [Roseivirga thermotolerans]GHE73195.1 hypothetical protein GCM10011340_32160 [Roseivirga thermotolerans]